MNMLYGLGVDQGILPSREGIWGFDGTARYGKSGGDTAINYYVDKNHPSAFDGTNDGMDPEAPFLTIQAAINACTTDPESTDMQRI